jgi:uncharacterized protein (DUF2249 family)
MSQDCSINNEPNKRYAFDARGIAKRLRRAAIIGALDSLHVGETMTFLNDHDPLALLQQLSQRYGERIEINYLSRQAGGVEIEFTLKETQYKSACQRYCALKANATTGENHKEQETR